MLLETLILIAPMVLGQLRDGPSISPGARRYLRLYREAYATKNRHSAPRARALYEGVKGRRRGKRAVTSLRQSHWPTTTIPYRFGFSGDRAREDGIRQGIKQWEQRTCLRFVQRSTSGPSLNFIIGGGCYSSVGTRGRRQDISIGRGCERPGIVAHEIAHALGMWHEQSRPDRDRTLRVSFENIASGVESNFAKRSGQDTNDLGVALDVGSVMMYGRTAFSKNGRPTISAVDPNYEQTFGNRQAISFTDAKQMNLLYCRDMCGRANLGCENGGYADPKSCGQCRCPEGLGGSRCTEAASLGCGGTLTATRDWQSLSSRGRNCAWLLQNDGGRIEVELESVDFPRRSPCTSYVEVKYSRDFEVAGPRFCGVSGRRLGSEGDKVVVIATGSGSFTGRFRAVGGGGTPSPRPITTPSTTPRTTRQTTAGGGDREWGQWSRCTMPCGGCGTRYRERVINSGRTTQRLTLRCNTQPCAYRSEVDEAPADTPSEGLVDIEEGVQIDEPEPITPRPRRSRGGGLLDRYRGKRQSRWCCRGFRMSRGTCVPRRPRG